MKLLTMSHFSVNRFLLWQTLFITPCQYLHTVGAEKKSPFKHLTQSVLIRHLKWFEIL